MVTIHSTLSARQFIQGEPPSETSQRTFRARQLWHAAGARLRTGFDFSTRCAGFAARAILDLGASLEDCIVVVDTCSSDFSTWSQAREGRQASDIWAQKMPMTYKGDGFRKTEARRHAGLDLGVLGLGRQSWLD